MDSFNSDSRTSRRELLIATTGLALSGSWLTACGGASKSVTAATSTAKAVGAKPLTLTIWDWTYDEATPFGKAQKAIDDSFRTKYPKITLDHQQKPYSQYFTLLQSAVARRKGPDVVMNYGASFAAEYARGLTDLSARAKDVRGLQFIPENRTGDQLLTVPYTTYLTRLGYNKALLRKVGLDAERPPQTWDEFLAACAKLKSAGITPIAAGFKDGYYGEWLMYSLTNQTLSNEDVLKQYQRELPWTAPGIRTALNYVVALGKAGYFSADAASRPATPDPAEQFQAGKAAFVIAQETDLAETGKAIGRADLGQMLMPRVPESKYPQPVVDATSNLGWSITKWSDQAEAAWAYIAHTLSPASQQQAWKPGGYIPNNSEAEVASSYAPEKQLLSWVSDNRKPHFGITFSSQEEALFDKQMPQLIRGRVSVDALLGQLEALRQKLGPVRV